MKKIKEKLKSSFIFILEKKVIQYVLAGGVIILLLIPVSKVINNKFFTPEDDSNKKLTDLIDESILAQGTINTDAIGEQGTTVSRYNIDDGFSEVENKSESSNSTSTSVEVNKSFIGGTDITILEGSDFEPLKDLKLYATDKDGSDITSKLVIEESNVNTENASTYFVRTSVKLNDGSKIERTFRVYVKATNLEVSLNSFKASENEVKKGESIVLDLDIKSSKKYVKATSAIINGKEYSLYSAKNGLLSSLTNIQKYKVKVDSETLAGQKEYKLSHIKMSDGSLIEVNSSAKVEVLKSQAIVKNFKYVGYGSSKKINTKFDLQDSDNSASNLKLQVYKDKKLISTKELDKKDSYNIDINTETNGIYEIKVIANINVHAQVTENNTILNKELLTETITINNIDESSLTGTDAELQLGDTFDAMKHLNLKATDVHGEDVTNKIVIDKTGLDVNTAGTYTVSAYFVNSNNKKIAATFNITVIENNEDEGIALTSLDEEILPARMMRSVREIFQGNKGESSTNVNVTITGTVRRSDNTVPGGRIQVEMPTTLAFTVYSSGDLYAAPLTITNQSDFGISVSVASFTETETNGGITVHPSSTTLEDKDRANVHLYLTGDRQVDLGEKVTSERPILELDNGATGQIQLTGDVGKAKGEKVDNNGVTEDFNLIFKIRKKN